ncbi:MAG: copper chaperone PCu(A)C [Paracoccaceae bacterium]
MSIFVLAMSSLSVIAGDVSIIDAYFRTSGPLAKTGGAFMHIANHSDQDDRLLSITSDIAKRVEMHTHIDAGDGVMLMRQVKGGFAIPAQGMHMLARGGDHLMFMGLTRKVADGDMITVVMTFEKTGVISVEIPVDQTREPEEDNMHMDHGSGG